MRGGIYMNNHFKSGHLEDSFTDYMFFNDVKKKRYGNVQRSRGGSSNTKTVLITVISFVISALITNYLGLEDTPLVIVAIVLWIAIGLVLAWFHDEIPGLKDIR